MNIRGFIKAVAAAVFPAKAGIGTENTTPFRASDPRGFYPDHREVRK